MGGWYRHPNGEWGLAEQKLESEQFIKDRDGNVLRDDDAICGRWARYFSSLLIAISTTVDRAVIEKISQ